VVNKTIEHLRQDNTRLLRLHLQRIRDDWEGPEARTDSSSDYVKAVINADRELGRFIAALKEEGVWDKTYLIVAADHGMGRSSRSNHPANHLESWQIFMGFYGPGVKRGVTIPYAESPDIAILTSHLLGTEALQGHTDSDIEVNPRGTTGTLLKNIFEGQSDEIEHPRAIERYLQSENFAPSTEYTDYREAMIEIFGG